MKKAVSRMLINRDNGFFYLFANVDVLLLHLFRQKCQKM